MDNAAITFAIKREGSFISGFRLTAVETEAECFCVSFPFAVARKKAKVEFRDGRIVFMHDGLSQADIGHTDNIYAYSTGGTFETPVDKEDAEQLQDLLNGRGEYAGCKLRSTTQWAFAKGFELVAEKADEDH